MTIKPSKSQSVRQCEAALKARGGRRMPSGMLQPDAAQALDELVVSGYARSAVAAISSAILDAHKKIARNPK